MPGLSGFDVLAHLPQELPMIVFVTAYDRYAMQAFEARAIDYVLKPVDDARFAATLTHVREHMRASAPPTSATSSCSCSPSSPAAAKSTLDELLEHGRKRARDRRPEVLPIRQGRETVRVPVESIEWVDAAGDYLCIHAGGHTHILRATMREMEKLLDPRLFQRVHRSTIVNLRRARACART